MPVHCVKGLGVAFAAAAMLVATAARADDFDAGEIGASRVVSSFRDGIYGDFTDTFNFSIAADKAFRFSFIADQGAAFKFWVDFSNASLFRGDEFLKQSTGVRYAIFSSIELSDLVLGEGEYHLSLSGYGGSIPQYNGGAFDARLQFAEVPVAPVAPVPEPGSLGVLALGLAMVGVMWRRSGASRRAADTLSSTA